MSVLQLRYFIIKFLFDFIYISKSIAYCFYILSYRFAIMINCGLIIKPNTVSQWFKFLPLGFVKIIHIINLRHEIMF